MKDIGTDFVDNIDLFTEFSGSVQAMANWWNRVKANLESPNPTLLPVEKGSSDASEIFSKSWAEMKQEFQQYHNAVRLYFCQRVLLPAERASNLNITLGELGTQALPRTPRIFQHELTI